MILNLISGPRNVSTALMYSFAQRGDTEVADEPFYAVYLAKSGAPHPGREAVLQALPSDDRSARDAILLNRRKPVLFIKNMAHHMEVLDEPFVDGATNIFLIRDPHQILTSYAEVIAKPVMRDIGIAAQYAFFKSLRDDGKNPIVLDSAELLQDPSGVLAKLCRHCGLVYEQRMVHWPAGPKAYDGVWAPHWYNNVHGSSGFEKQKTATRPLPKHLESLYLEARTLYEKLLPFSIKA